MKLLLDTHIALWAAEGAPHLSATATALIEHPENTLYVSAASTWEIAIKYRKGNLPVHPRVRRSGSLVLRNCRSAAITSKGSPHCLIFRIMPIRSTA
ncbi:twitching motility protein PilT [Burkholderia aenigmatica]|uniref:Twitching motility protein PilT n=1 Tax=Burkholderia aenigmatica TaxID=2015348 RepID=A0A6P2T431_9BURK|nr:twitching motility protein PilT [Burkholderia aenigmatica]